MLSSWGNADDAIPRAPYPPSSVIDHIAWDWKTRQTAAPGSDLWPVTWMADDTLFAAFGDGGGFGGTDSDGRVALGFARIDGTPEQFTGININGGKNARHPPSFPKKGKVGGILAVENRVYAWLNTQNGKWPDVDEALIWSDDAGITWRQADAIYPKGDGNLKLSTFLNFGKGYTGLPDEVRGYVYFYGQKQGRPNETFLGRAPAATLPDRRSHEFLIAVAGEKPQWSANVAKAVPVFADPAPNGDLASVVYLPALKRYLLTSFHNGPGQLGIFDSPHPWGPWTTVAYEEHWGDMGHNGEGLTCSFPAKWISGDGRTLWCVFSAYGGTAKEGINAHDKFNLVKATLGLKK
ncbi:MAG TPA: DUF4185 domain-containing protein [Tepidisphaeraceae bacterium]|jgi:hypothetical protein|nr:DUF4185 domain-containing protein [Tepidisphaeraceae bacterium]